MDPVYIIVILGIFVTISLSIVVYILINNQLKPGYWPLIAAATLFLTLAEYFRSILNKVSLGNIFIIITIVLIFFAALIKFWDTLRMIEQRF